MCLACLCFDFISATKAGGVVEKVQGVKVSLTLDYDMIGKVQYFCGQNNWHIEDTEYTDISASMCTITLSVYSVSSKIGRASCRERV